MKALALLLLVAQAPRLPTTRCLSIWVAGDGRDTVYCNDEAAKGMRPVFFCARDWPSTPRDRTQRQFPERWPVR